MQPGDHLGSSHPSNIWKRRPGTLPFMSAQHVGDLCINGPDRVAEQLHDIRIYAQITQQLCPNNAAKRMHTACTI